MRRVQARPFRDYFRNRAEDRFGPGPGFDWDSFFYENRTRFNRQWAVLFLLLAFLALSFFSREFLVLFSSGVVCLVALFFRTRAIAHGLHVSRSIPTRARERQLVHARYEIRNASEFRAPQLWVRDFFAGSRSLRIRAAFPEGARALSIVSTTLPVKCDGGMGTHPWGPLVATVTDPFGLFEFTVIEDEPAHLEVLPEYLELDGFGILESVDSAAIGRSESVRSGQSSSFLGIREYAPGDPLKRVNWKLSARHRELLVNVYESMVHTDLTVCVDMDASNHIGRGGESTWETCKDAAVAIFWDQRPKTHRMQLISQAARAPFDRGSAHLLTLVNAVSRLEPVKAPRGERPSLLRDAAAELPYGSSLVYVVPVYRNDVPQLSRTLAELQSRAIRCVVVLVEAAGFVDPLPTGLALQAIADTGREAKATRDRILQENAQLGVPTYVVRRGETIPRALAREAVPR